MPRPLRQLTALVAVAALPLGLAACGGGIPSDAVATVQGTPITQSDFNRWIGIAARASGQQTPGQPVVAPIPPDFKACIAAKRAQLPKPAAGQPQVTDAQIRSECQSEFDQLKTQVMQLLISSSWIEQEAQELGINVSDADVRKQLQKSKKQAFPNEAAYQAFLRQSGQTEEDVLFRIRGSLLSNKIRDAVTKGKNKATDAQIAAYYAANRQQYAQPERRNLLVVLTRTKAQADAAKAALDSGQSWAVVAKRYSSDPQSKGQGGQLNDVTRGQQDQALDQKAFAASVGKTIGPFKGSFGWYVVRVTKVTAGRQQSLSEVHASIRQLLQSQGQQKALDAFVKDFQSTWKSRTDCRKGYEVDSCKNAPKQQTQQIPGQVPQQQAPQQQAPQQQAPTQTGP